MSSIHDKIRAKITEEALSPAAAKLAEKKAAHSGSSEPIKVSPNSEKGIIPFPHAQTRPQPCLSIRLSPDAVRTMPRSQDPHPSQVPDAKSHQMHDEDAAFFRSGLLGARDIAKDCINFLIRHDTGISLDDCRILADAINAIDRAGVPT